MQFRLKSSPIFQVLKVLATALLILVLAYLVAYAVADLLDVLDIVDDSRANYFYFVVYFVISLVVVLCLAFIHGIRWNNKDKFAEALDIKKVSISDLKYTLGGYLSYLLIAVIVFSVIRHFDLINLSQSQAVGFNSSTGGFELAFIALVLLTPIHEELLMRGFLFRRLKQHLSFYPALVIASVAFALLHLDLAIMVDTFLLSVVVIMVYQKTKNLTTAILIHAIKNMVAVLTLVIELKL